MDSGRRTPPHDRDRGRPTERQGDRSRSPSNGTHEDRQPRLEGSRRDGTRNLIPVTDNSQRQQSNQQEFRISQQSSALYITERVRTTNSTENMGTAQQWETHQTFLRHLEQVSPENVPENAREIYKIEGVRTTESTRDMSTKQQWETHDVFLQHLEQVSPKNVLENAQEIYRIERERFPRQNGEISEGSLVAFTTDKLEDPEKVFPDEGPKNSHEHEMIWAIIGHFKGKMYPRYSYLEHEKYQKRYRELRKWTLDEFAKWQEANSKS